MLDGAINIRDLETQYELKLPQDEGYETLAGFLLSRLQKMPTGGEAFDYEGRRFVVEKMEGHRIATVRIEPVPAPPAVPAASAGNPCAAGRRLRASSTSDFSPEGEQLASAQR